VTFSDLDQPVSITAPAAASVLPLSRSEQDMLRAEIPFAFSK
jgi:hypothetical protein